MSLGEHNPYAVPQAELQAQSRPDTGRAVLYPMSPRKAAVMSVLTFTLYDIVFWYRHWERLQWSGHNVMPVIRAIFSVFTSFSFVTTLVTVRAARDLPSGQALRACPGIYLTLNLAAHAADKVLEGVAGLAFTMFASAASAWVLATVQSAANEVLKADNYQGPSNSGANLSAILTGGAGLVFWAFVIVASVNPALFETE